MRVNITCLCDSGWPHFFSKRMRNRHAKIEYAKILEGSSVNSPTSLSRVGLYRDTLPLALRGFRDREQGERQAPRGFFAAMTSHRHAPRQFEPLSTSVERQAYSRRSAMAREPLDL